MPELSHRRRLLEVRFFRSVPFSGATVIAVCAFGALGGFLFLNSLYLQDVRDLSALQAGLHTLPMAVLTAIVAPLWGRIVSARGPRLPLILAGSAIALAMLPLTRLAPDTPIWLLFGSYALFGFGFGMVNALTGCGLAVLALGLATTGRRARATAIEEAPPAADPRPVAARTVVQP